MLLNTNLLKNIFVMKYYFFEPVDSLWMFFRQSTTLFCALAMSLMLQRHSGHYLHCGYMMSCIIDMMLFVFPVKDSAPYADETQTAAQETAEGAADAGAVQEDRYDKSKDKDEKDKEKTKEKSKEKDKDEKDKEPDKEKVREKEAERKGEGDKEKAKGVEGTNLDSLLQRLPGCVSRDLIDQLTVIPAT